MTAVQNLSLPVRTGSRQRAGEFLKGLPLDLSNGIVVVDGTNLAAVASSFVDEVVKVVLVERNAHSLVLQNTSETANQYARDAARRREVADRLHVE